MQALITLTPAESKRLIAKGIVTQPEIINAKQEGYLLVGRGSTNAYILEELLGEPVAKERYCAGQVIKGFLCVLGAGERIQPVTFHRGEVLRVDPAEVLDKLTPGDILLKGQTPWILMEMWGCSWLIPTAVRWGNSTSP